MLAFLVLARLLAPKDFGLIALAAVVIAFLETFTDQGFAQAIVQRAELEAEHCDTAFGPLSASLWLSAGSCSPSQIRLPSFFISRG